jgi:hypothetical protein
MVTGSTVESIDSKGLRFKVQNAGDGDKLSMLIVSPEVMKGVIGRTCQSIAGCAVVKMIQLPPVPKEEEVPEQGA